MTTGQRILGSLGSAPRFSEFFALFARAGTNAQQATELLASLVREWPDNLQRKRLDLRELEQTGDRITHDVIHHLNVTSVAPFGGSDAYALISKVDDIVDYAEEVGDFMGLYRIEAPTDHAIALAEVLESAGREIAVALGRLRDLRSLRPHVVAIERLERDGDRAEREALASLFDGGIDPMVVIRWKDIYERLEAGIDACRRVASILDGIAVRYG